MQEYLENMADGQDSIYYLTADTLKQALSSPHLEGFKSKDIDVLLMTDPIDAFWMSQMAQFNDKKFISISRDTYDLSEIGSKETKAPKKSKAILSLSKVLVEKYKGRVPKDMQSLEELPGVGHKTASVVISQGFGLPAFPVDTHIHRLAQRWGLSKGRNVKETEKDLKKIFPRHLWNKLHLQIIFYGREYCTARGCDGRSCEICNKCYPNRLKPFKANKA